MAVNIDRNTFPAEGGDFRVNITKDDNRPWVVNIPTDSWHRELEEAVSNFLYRLDISIDENTGASDRSFIFTAGSDLETDAFTITQYGTGSTLTADIISATSGSTAASGGQVTVDVYANGGTDSLTTASSDQTYCTLTSTTHGVTSGGVTCTRFVFTFSENTGTSSRSATLTFTVSDGGGNTATATLSRTQEGALVQTGSLSVANASVTATATTANAVISLTDMRSGTLQVDTVTFSFVTSATIQVVGGAYNLVMLFPANTGSARTETIQISGEDNWGNTLTATMTLTQGASGATRSITASWDGSGSLGYEGGTETASVVYSGTWTGDASLTYGTLPDGLSVSLVGNTQVKVVYTGGSLEESISIPITVSRLGSDSVTYSVDLVFLLRASGVFPIWKDVFGVIASDEDYEDYELQEGGALLYAGRAFAYPDEQNIRVNISRVVAPYLTTYYKDVDFYAGSSLLASYTFVRDYSYDKSMDYSQDQWLNKPVNGRVPSGVKLCVAMWGASAGGSMQVSEQGGSLVVNKTLAKGLNTGEWISGSIGQTYTFGDEVYVVVDACEAVLLKYVNAYGGIDFLLVEGVSKKTDKITRASYEKDAAAGTTDFETADYQASMSAEWRGTTGWLTDEQSARMKHLVESVEVYMVTEDGDEVPVVMRDSSLEYKTFNTSGRKLVNYTLTWNESQKKIRR